jgi:hypothetical protein
MNKKRENASWIVVVGFLTAVLSFLNTLSSNGIWSALIVQIKEGPHLLWMRVFSVFISAYIILFTILLLTRTNLFAEISDIYNNSKISFYVRLAGVILVNIFFIIIILLAFHEDRSLEAKALFPQGDKYGPILIRTYAANGEVNYFFNEKTPLQGPKGYAKITLKTYGKTEEYNCGWVLFLLKGVDISRYKEIRFKLRGERGNEAIGIKAKDAKGVEVSLLLERYYLINSKITPEWQQVSIPLDHFGKVDFGFMDNFSFFTNGRIAGTRPQTIYVGEFELL